MQWTLHTCFLEIRVFFSTILILFFFYWIGMFNSLLKVYFISVFSRKLKLKVSIHDLKVDLWSGRCEFFQITLHHPPASIDPRWRSEIMAYADEIICTFDPLLSLYGYVSTLWYSNKKFAFFDTITVKGIDLFVEGYETDITATGNSITTIASPSTPSPHSVPPHSITPSDPATPSSHSVTSASHGTVPMITTTTTVNSTLGTKITSGNKTTLNLKLIGGEQKNFQRLRKPTYLDQKNHERLEKRRRRQQIAQERAHAAAQTIRGRSGSVSSPGNRGVDGSSHGSGQGHEHHSTSSSVPVLISVSEQAQPVLQQPPITRPPPTPVDAHNCAKV
jgi:hypothetical protein